MVHVQSYTRQLLLKAMGVDYLCEPADIDEKAIRHPEPQVKRTIGSSPQLHVITTNGLTPCCTLQKLVEALANAKANALLSRENVIAFAKDGPTLLLTR
jgi:predicted house-cleaning NTP pyrophosphatase (Maf/HAM1 superfamily)